MGYSACLLLLVPASDVGAGVLPRAVWERYDLVVWFVLRGSMGRQGSSDSQALSWWTLFLRELLVVGGSLRLNQPFYCQICLFAPSHLRCWLGLWGKFFRLTNYCC